MLGLALALAWSGCASGAGTQVITRGGDAGAGEPDAGSSVLDDAAPPDVGPFDAGPPDAGPLDAGPPDARVCVPETCNGLDDDCDDVIDDGAVCPCDVRSLVEGTYLLCAEPRTWGAARAMCEGLGYRLATIEDATEDAAIYGAIAARGWIDTWIGLTDEALEGAWTWSSGAPLDYVHWDEGEPNDAGEGGEDCGVIMTMSGRESEWDDRHCANERPFVCEVDGD